MKNHFALWLISIAIASTGVSAECPVSWDDAQVLIDDPHPQPAIGTPLLTITGLQDFMLANNIGTVDELLSAMPDSMKNNHALVEQSRSGNLGSLAHPRMILFGSDARLLMAIGSDPSDPNIDIVDVAELTPTGDWKFRSLDFTDSPVSVSADDSSCVGCHGNPARPIWGTYPNWPGMFGPQDDNLTVSQAEALNALVNNQTNLERFRHLKFVNQLDIYGRPYQAGDNLVLPDRYYPFANTDFNMELGTALAESIYLRIKNHSTFEQLRDEMLVLGYCRSADPVGYQSSGAKMALEQTLAELGVDNPTISNLYRHFGIEPDHEFSVHKLAGESPQDWNVSTDSIGGLVELLVLNELMNEDSSVLTALEESPDLANGFSRGCFENIAQSLRYKVYQGWTLRTEARQLAREADFDIDLLRSGQGVFDLAAENLCPVLFDRVANGSIIVDGDGDGIEDSQDNCSAVANSLQRDTDGDGYGNSCDPDLDNNLTVNFVDLSIFSDNFLNTGSNLDADFNGDDVVNFLDFNIMKLFFFGPPGPSGIASD